MSKYEAKQEKGRSDKDWIQMSTGTRFYPLNPRPEEVDVKAIAHSLSQQCRWTGHTKEFYSIAQHSVRVMLGVKRCGESPEVQLRALHHDDSEAFIADINRPSKLDPRMKGYKIIEKDIQAAVYTAFGLSPAYEAHDSIVKHHDGAVLAQESEELMPFRVGRRLPTDPIVKFEYPNSIKWARRRYLYHHYRLMGELEGEKGSLNNAKSLFRAIFR